MTSQDDGPENAAGASAAPERGVYVPGYDTFIVHSKHVHGNPVRVPGTTSLGHVGADSTFPRPTAPPVVFPPTRVTGPESGPDTFYRDVEAIKSRYTAADLLDGFKRRATAAQAARQHAIDAAASAARARTLHADAPSQSFLLSTGVADPYARAYPGTGAAATSLIGINSPLFPSATHGTVPARSLADARREYEREAALLAARAHRPPPLTRAAAQRVTDDIASLKERVKGLAEAMLQLDDRTRGAGDPQTQLERDAFRRELLQATRVLSDVTAARVAGREGAGALGPAEERAAEYLADVRRGAVPTGRPRGMAYAATQGPPGGGGAEGSASEASLRGAERGALSNSGTPAPPASGSSGARGGMVCEGDEAGVRGAAAASSASASRGAARSRAAEGSVSLAREGGSEAGDVVADLARRLADAEARAARAVADREEMARELVAAREDARASMQDADAARAENASLAEALTEHEDRLSQFKRNTPPLPAGDGGGEGAAGSAPPALPGPDAAREARAEDGAAAAARRQREEGAARERGRAEEVRALREQLGEAEALLEEAVNRCDDAEGRAALVHREVSALEAAVRDLQGVVSSIEAAADGGTPLGTAPGGLGAAGPRADLLRSPGGSARYPPPGASGTPRRGAPPRSPASVARRSLQGSLAASPRPGGETGAALPRLRAGVAELRALTERLRAAAARAHGEALEGDLSENCAMQ
ncbi:unnamed protein product [Pedinophyceae sp. YPF-701]|nr:unnamed protein product [Pedinophyceae sp. YPF-701]